MSATFDGSVLTVVINEAIIPAELEVDHSLEATLPEFSVYASENPYGDSQDEFEALDVTVEYVDGTWTITFPEEMEDELSDIKFYLRVIAANDNGFGSMYNGGYLTVQE
jgi:hypothetical protein